MDLELKHIKIRTNKATKKIYVYPKYKQKLSGLELPRKNKYLGIIHLRQEREEPFWNQEDGLDIGMDLIGEVHHIMRLYNLRRLFLFGKKKTRGESDE